MFGTTSKEWKKSNPEKALSGLNIRDFADVPQLTVLANLESHNADLIRQGLPPKERILKLRELAIIQLKSLRNINFTYPIESPHISPFSNQNHVDNSLKDLLSESPKKDMDE